MPFTIVQYYGKHSGRCGYCCQTASKELSMHAYIMTPEDYQNLIDRGWRRSGQYCYKPNNRITCCPSYTIRCDSQEFKLSKSHKKILKRMNKFLSDGIKEKDNSTHTLNDGIQEQNSDNLSRSTLCIKDVHEIPDFAIKNIDVSKIVKEETSNQIVSKMFGETKKESDATPKPELLKETKKRIDETRPSCKKAKQIRLERKQAKCIAKGILPPEKNVSPRVMEKTLKDYINETPKNGVHKLQVKLVPSNKGVTEEVIELYRKYQVSVHKDPPEKLTQNSFERFLVRSPLKHTITPDGPQEGFGSFHQQYWLDGRLIAVGVIDILPNCLSSVYFFYDPEFSFLSLGTYGSLREIDFTRQLSEKVPSLKHYYMGFYIHSCPKMIYKGRLTPSYLLCPEVYSWHLLTDEIRKKLNESKYCRFNEDVNAKDLNKFSESDLGLVLIFYHNKYITYQNFIQNVSKNINKSEVIEYGELVGKICAHKMIYVVD